MNNLYHLTVGCRQLLILVEQSALVVFVIGSVVPIVIGPLTELLGYIGFLKIHYAVVDIGGSVF